MQFSSRFAPTTTLHTTGLKVSGFKTTTKKVNFDFAMNSVNLPSFDFTNFLVKKSPLVKFVRGEYIKLLDNKIDLDDSTLYAPTLVSYSDPLLKLKLITIIEKTRNTKVDKLPMIYKFKNKENQNFQIYVANDITNNYEVLAIDLYHLLIPAPDKSRGETVEHSKEKYEKYKLADYNLSEIKR